MTELSDFDTRVCGIPCGVVIDDFERQEPFKGHSSQCNSDVDYYGYNEVYWHLIDREGYKAKWLENKMSDSDRDKLNNELKERW